MAGGSCCRTLLPLSITASPSCDSNIVGSDRSAVACSSNVGLEAISTLIIVLLRYLPRSLSGSCTLSFVQIVEASSYPIVPAAFKR